MGQASGRPMGFAPRPRTDGALPLQKLMSPSDDPAPAISGTAQGTDSEIHLAFAEGERPRVTRQQIRVEPDEGLVGRRAVDILEIEAGGLPLRKSGGRSGSRRAAEKTKLRRPPQPLRLQSVEPHRTEPRYRRPPDRHR